VHTKKFVSGAHVLFFDLFCFHPGAGKRLETPDHFDRLQPPELRGHRTYDVVSPLTGVSVLNEIILPLLQTALVGAEVPVEPAGDQRPQLEKTRSFRIKFNAGVMRFAGIEPVPLGEIEASANSGSRLCEQFWSSTCRYGEQCTYSHSPVLKHEREASQKAARKRRNKMHKAKGEIAITPEMSAHDQARVTARIANKRQQQKKKRDASEAPTAARDVLSPVASA